MAIKIALAGNPNCGKTTLFNDLTGSNQYVGNWPGVTVEKKEGKLKGHNDVVIQDLPGIYSLSPYTLEEVVARGYLVGEKPDAILNIIDGTNIERNLYLTTQLIELGIPVVMAVNMIDLVRKNGDKIDLKRLSKELGCEAIGISALKGEGSRQAAELAVTAARDHQAGELPHVFTGSVEHALAHIEESIQGKVDDRFLRWYAVKLFERDDKVQAELGLDPALLKHLDLHITDCEKEMDDDAESIITNQRYAYINTVVSRAVKKKERTEHLTMSDKIDRIVTNRILALPIFAVIMALIYTIAMGSTGFSFGTMATDWTNDVLFGEIVPPAVEGFLTSIGCADWLVGLINDGIVAGVGAVLGFVPQMLVLFLLLSIMEDIGYMARVAFIMDRIFRKFGLSGKSFIPMLISSGCGVPGVMATKTIENEKDRRMTAMLTTMIPCGAKTPIIALVMGVLIGGSDAWWVAPMFYFLGLAAIIVSALMLKKTKMFAGEPAPFVMELPDYHFPTLKSWWLHVWERISAYLKKAATIIFAASVVVWFLLEFGFASWAGGDGSFGFLSLMEGAPEYYTDYSLLAMVGNAVAWIFAPLGADTWQAAAASINALIAKENLVSTFGVIFGIGDATENSVTMWSGFAGMFTDGAGVLHVGAMCAFVAFNMLDAPCFAAIGTIRRQMDSPKWFWFAIGYQCVFAWCVGLIINQLWELFALGNFGVWTVVAFVLLAGMIFQIVRPMPRDERPDEKILSDLSESAA